MLGGIDFSRFYFVTFASCHKSAVSSMLRLAKRLHILLGATRTCPLTTGLRFTNAKDNEVAANISLVAISHDPNIVRFPSSLVTGTSKEDLWTEFMLLLVAVVADALLEKKKKLKFEEEEEE